MESRALERNYGATVTKETYEWGLRLHQYIPQADQGILDDIELFAKERGNIRVLDLGCGPGRLTGRIASLPHVEVEGLDESPEFIEAARKENPGIRYIESDFLEHESARKYDVIMMQGVFHHVHGQVREAWLRKIADSLAPGGRLIIGDEFIPEYEDGNETERKTKAGLFYLHIIGEAEKGRAEKGDMDLAKEECINFIADVLSGEESCGYYDNSTICYIKEEARALNDRLFNLHERITAEEAYAKTNEIIANVRAHAEMLKAEGAEKRIDRGDYKVSIAAFREELAPYFTAVPDTERLFGPVSEIGGMGVLVFEKRNIESPRIKNFIDVQ